MTVTPNIGIFIPSAGETNYSDSFASGMINIDQHDHSGGPNKGLPITSSALGPFSVTYDKLNMNVVDTTSGIGTNPLLQNQLQMLGILKALYVLAQASGVGFVAMNGNVVNARRLTPGAGISISNQLGEGDPVIAATNGPATVTNITGTTNQIKVTPTGTVFQISFDTFSKNPTQPLFSAQFIKSPPGSVQDNVTGDGTTYIVLFPTVNVNQGGYYDGNSIFTAPIAGNYLIGTNLFIDDINAANYTQIDIYVNGSIARTIFYGNTAFMVAATQQNIELSGQELLVLNLNDKVTIRLTVLLSSSSKRIDIDAAYFSAVLLW